MKITSKILLSFTPLATILVMVGVFFTIILTRLDINTSEILTSNYRSVSALENMRLALEQFEWVAKKYDSRIISKNFFENQRVIYQADLERNLEIQTNNVTVSGEDDITNNLVNIWSQVVRKVDNLPPNSSVINNITNELIILNDNIDLLIKINQDDSFFKSQYIVEMIHFVTNITFIFASAGFVIGVILSIFILGKILQPFRNLCKAVKSIGNGEVGVELDINGEDEIAELAKEFDTMLKTLEEYRNSSTGKVIRAKIFLQAALDTMPDPMLIISREYEIENFNEQASKVFNLRLGEKYQLEGLLPEDVFKDLSIDIRKALVTKDFNHSAKPFFMKNSSQHVEYFPLIRPIEQTGIGINSIGIILRNIIDVDMEGYIKVEKVISAIHGLLPSIESTQIGLHIAIEQKIGALNSEQARILGIAQNSCLESKEQINNILDYNSDASIYKMAHLDDIYIDQVLKKSLKEFQLIAEEKNVTVDLDSSHVFSELIFSYEKISLIFRNIFTGIFHLSAKKSEVNIKLFEKADHFSMIVTSSSINKTQEEIDKILTTDAKNNDLEALLFKSCKELGDEKCSFVIKPGSEGKPVEFNLTFKKSK